MEKAVTPLPRKQLIIIWIIHASQGFQTTMLFPMLVFMVEKYDMRGKEDRATGYYAGLLASLYPLAQCCSSVLWGLISDKYGRKPWLAFGNIVSASSSMLLGLTQTFAHACMIRFLGGLLNGTLTITKSAMANLCDGTNQAQGFGILNLAWAIGATLGPIISGALAQPCIQYDLPHCPTLLKSYPFFLPCLIATIFSTIAIGASFWFDDTNVTTPDKQVFYERIPSEELLNIGSIVPSPSSKTQLQSQELQFMRKNFDVESDIVQKDGMLRTKENGPENDSLDTNHPQPKISASIEKSDNEKTACCCALMSSNNCACAGAMVDQISIDGMEDFISPHLLANLASPKPILKDRDVILSSLCYSMTGLIFIITDELFPLYGASSQAMGGLGLNSSNVGIILGVGGLVLIVYTLAWYPQVAKHFGPLLCFRYGTFGSIPLWLFFPAASLLSNRPTLLRAVLVFAMSVRSIIACTTFTGVLILVSNSATAVNMGIVTGLSHSLCSFFRAIGPAVGGAIWSYSLTQSFPFHQFLAWELVVLLSLCTFGLSFMLSPTLVLPKDNR